MKSKDNNQVISAESAEYFQQAEKLEKEEKYIESLALYKNIIACKVKFEDTTIANFFYNSYKKIADINIKIYNKLCSDSAYLKSKVDTIPSSIPLNGLSKESFLKLLYLKDASDNYYLAQQQCEYKIDNETLFLKYEGQNISKEIYNSSIEKIISFIKKLILNSIDFINSDIKQCKIDSRYKEEILEKDKKFINSVNKEVKSYVSEIKTYSDKEKFCDEFSTLELYQSLINKFYTNDFEEVLYNKDILGDELIN